MSGLAVFYLLPAAGFGPLLGFNCQVSGFRIDKFEFSANQILNTET
jgi:hypothetical protein